MATLGESAVLGDGLETDSLGEVARVTVFGEDLAAELLAAPIEAAAVGDFSAWVLGEEVPIAEPFTIVVGEPIEFFEAAVLRGVVDGLPRGEAAEGRDGIPLVGSEPHFGMPGAKPLSLAPMDLLAPTLLLPLETPLWCVEHFEGGAPFAKFSDFFPVDFEGSALRDDSWERDMFEVLLDNCSVVFDFLLYSVFLGDSLTMVRASFLLVSLLFSS